MPDKRYNRTPLSDSTVSAVQRTKPGRQLQTGATLIWFIVWLLGMAAIVYWCVDRHLPAIQEHILGNARAAVADSQVANVNLAVDGREAVLWGAVANEEQKLSVFNAVRNADGIRTVKNNLTILAQVETANSAQSDENIIVKSAVPVTPEPSETQALNTADNTSTEPETKAEPETSTVAETAETNDTPPDDSDAELVAQDNNVNDKADGDSGIAAVANAIATAPTTTDAEPKPTENTSAKDDSVEAKANALIQQALQRRDQGESLIDPETPKPQQASENKQQEPAIEKPAEQQTTTATELTQPSFSMQVEGDKLVMGGDMSNRDSLLVFVQSAMTLFNANYVINGVQVSEETAQANWLPSLTAFLPFISSVENAGINITDSQITLSGVAGSEEQHDAVINQALSGLPGLSLVERISISEATVTDTTTTATNSTNATTDTNTQQSSATGNLNANASQQATTESAPELLRREFNSLADTAILFESGSDVLTDESRTTVQAIADLFLLYTNVDVDINGHTDSVGNAQANLELSQLRANAVRDYLVQLGVSDIRLNAYGFGDGVPIADNGTVEGRRLNRRIEFNF